MNRAIPTAAPLAQVFEQFRVLTDAPTLVLLAVVLALLLIAQVVGWLLRRQPDTTVEPALVRAFNGRINAWLLMYAVLALGFLLGPGPTTFLFFCISFFALREFITIAPTRLGDHRALFWVFFFFCPVQYLLIYIGPRLEQWGVMEQIVEGPGPHLHGLYSIMIPVYAFLFVPTRVALAGDPRRFLERTAKIQAGLMICVYALSFAPALLYLKLWTMNTPDGEWEPWKGSSAGLVFYFILVVQLADLFRYLGNRLLGGEAIAPDIHTRRTWRGFLFSLAMTSLAGTALWWATPFTWWQSAALSMLSATLAFAGGMTMSAIKRDRGVKDYGTLVEGHAGVLDRLDSLCFAAPVFFHLTRYFFMILPMAQSN